MSKFKKTISYPTLVRKPPPIHVVHCLCHVSIFSIENSLDLKLFVFYDL